MAEITTETVEPEEQAQPAIARLLEYVNHQNVAELLDDTQRGNIGQEVLREYQIDKDSRADWEKKTQAAMDLAMQITQDKTFPWPSAANVKYPLLTTAAVQFQARAYPAIVPGRDIAKAEVIGADPTGEKEQRARRVGQHMSYQLTKQIRNWEEDTDRMLVVLPIEGTCFRKTYFDPRKGHNCSELVRAMDFVVNYKAKSLEEAPRATHTFPLYPHQIEERKRAGVYLDVDLGRVPGQDDDAPFDILEQHRLLDLDEDGYPEPYIVTVEKQSAKVLRVVAAFDLDGIFIGTESIGDILRNVSGAAESVGMDPQAAIGSVMPHVVDAQVVRIEKSSYFTKYGFIPNPESAVYDLGFGMLLNPINETVNTVLNQLLDAGTLANTGGGFIGSGVRMKAGAFRFAPGEYKRVESSGAALKENIVPLQFAGPSTVLFQLLGLLIDAGRDIASVKDILTGEQQQANVPATTTLALIEQGLKVFTAIYKRIHRSLGEELRKIYKLNRRFLSQEEYFTVLDGDPQKVTIADYNDRDLDVCPFSDPTISAEAQKLARAQAAMQLLGHPLTNAPEVMLRYYRAIGEEDPEKLIAPPQGPSPEQLHKLAELEIKRNESHAKMLSMMVDNITKLAQAESAEVGQQFGLYLEYLKVMNQQAESYAANGGRVSGMAGQRGNGPLPQLPQGMARVPGAQAPGPAGGMSGGLMGPDQAGQGAPQVM